MLRSERCWVYKSTEAYMSTLLRLLDPGRGWTRLNCCRASHQAQRTGNTTFVCSTSGTSP